MKNIVIAAGYATRLGELTKNFPKPLLKIGERNILERMLDDIDTIPEIDEHIVITNHKFAPIFEEWVKDVHYSKPITIVDDGTETNDTRLGAVCDLLMAIEFLDKRQMAKGEREKAKGEGQKVNDERTLASSLSPLATTQWPCDLLVVAADNLLFFSFKEFVDFALGKDRPAPLTGVRRGSCIMRHWQPSIEKLQRTGVVVLDENAQVVNMEEKPAEPKSHWAVPPFYIYLKEDLDLVRHSVENGCGKDAPGNLAHYMVDNTSMFAWEMRRTDGNANEPIRFDIGSLDTYREACERYGG